MIFRGKHKVLISFYFPLKKFEGKFELFFFSFSLDFLFVCVCAHAHQLKPLFLLCLCLFKSKTLQVASRKILLFYS